MKIGPCKDEFYGYVFLLLFPFVAYVACYNGFEIGTHSATEDALLLTSIIIFSVASGAWVVGSMVYFGRTRTLDSEGCRFCFGGFEKKYRWEELDVQYYENIHDHVFGHEIISPGILINVKAESIIRNGSQWSTAIPSTQ